MLWPHLREGGSTEFHVLVIYISAYGSHSFCLCGFLAQRYKRREVSLRVEDCSSSKWCALVCIELSVDIASGRKCRH